MISKNPKIVWYLAYVVQYFEFADKRPQKEYDVWVNVNLISADSLDQAYEKAMNLGKLVEEEITINGENGFSRFKGLSDLVQIYEEIEDGAELTFREIELSNEELEKIVQPKEKLTAFEESDRK